MPPLRAVLLAFLVALLPASAADYYVDASAGQDANGCGGSPGSSACRSIKRLLAERDLNGGDTVHVAPGEYREVSPSSGNELKIDTPDGGSASAPVLFLCEGAPGSCEINGLHPVDLDDNAFQRCTAERDCAGNGQAYPNTWRIDISGFTLPPDPFRMAETQWGTRTYRVCDNDPEVCSSDPSCDWCEANHPGYDTRSYGDATGVIFDFDQPLQLFSGYSSVADVNAVEGTFWYDGSRWLYVHTYFDESPVGRGMRIVVGVDTVVQIDADHVTLDGFAVRYGRYGIATSYSRGVTVRNAVISTAGVGFYSLSATDLTLEDSEVSHCYGRSRRDGTYGSWTDQAGGTNIMIRKADNATVRRVTSYNSWAGMSVTVKNSLFEQVLVKNSPNHTWTMSETDATTNDCTNNTIHRSIAINGQDHFYIAGCRDSKILRSAGGLHFQPATSSYPASTGWKVLSHLSSGGINVLGDSTSGWDSDRNWYKNEVRCKWRDTSRDCGTEWQQACNCDGGNQVPYGEVLLAGTSWPNTTGLSASRLDFSDFRPLTGSATINEGDRDLDGDGVLETGPGGDDECVPANNCHGTAPDIGPMEYDGPSDPTGPPPPDVDNLRRTDQQ